MSQHGPTRDREPSARGRSFRIAGPVGRRDTALDMLAAEGFSFSPEPFWDSAFSLEDGPAPLGASLAARLGLIYIQDKSSMLPPLLLDPEPGRAVLDMCASPGSKTGLLAMLTGPGGMALGNEPNRSRLDTLRRNLARTATINSATCTRNGQDLGFADESWRTILLDPPCSGWGTADKHPKVMDMWTEDKTGPLVRLQRELLAEAARMLAPGGRLMYSTCTTNPAENEDQAAWAVTELGLEILPLTVPAGFASRACSAPQARDCLLVDGQGSGSQGFFLALMSKPGDPGQALPDNPEPDLPGRPLTRAELAAAAPLDLDRLPPGRAWRFGDKVVFLHGHALEIIPKSLRYMGAPLGRLKGGKFHPAAHLGPLLPDKPAPGDLDLDSPGELERLLSGQSLPAPGKGPYAGLRFRGRAVGLVRIRNRRALWPGK